MRLYHAKQRRGTPRSRLGRAGLVAALMAALAAPLSGWDARPAAATPLPAPVLHEWTSPVGVGDIALGPDGNLWFVATDTGSTPTRTGLGKITPTGTITTYFDLWGGHCSAYYCQPNGLHFVGDVLYVSEDFEGTIWGFSVASGSPVATAGPVVSPGGHTPRQITDLGGYLYVTNYDGVNYFPGNLSSGDTCWGQPWTYDTNGIAVGPDGNIWTATGIGIGKVAPCTSGSATPTHYSTGLSQPANVEDIVSADGGLWFTNSVPASAVPGQNTIGRITTAGVITEYVVPSAVPASQPGFLGMMAVASDGSIWFTEGNLNQVGRLSPADPAAIAEYAMPGETRVNFLASGPGGTMWYSGWSPTNGAVIGELSLAQAPATPTSTTLTSSLNPSTYGQPVTLSASVTPGSGSVVPTGQVTFVVDGQNHAVPLDPAGNATYTTGATELGVGLHAVTAAYTPASASGFAASTSTVLQQHVNQPLGGVVRPDAWIRKHDWTGYVGNDIFNTSALRQTVTTQAPRAAARAFRVRVYNDGPTSAVVTVRATDSPRGAQVRYFTGGEDVTAAITSPQGLTFTRSPGAFKGFRVRIDVGRHAVVGSEKVAKVLVSIGAGATAQRDAVKAVVTVVRR